MNREIINSMAKMQKGRPGYIRVRKIRYLLGAIVEFAVVIALLVLGYMQTGSRLNLFTVIAVVGCLPASKMLVEFITMAPYGSVSSDIYKELEKKAPLPPRAYDLILTSPEKVMPVSVMFFCGHTICGYAQSDRVDEAKCAGYIREMLEKNGYEKMTVKIFHDYKAFLARAEGMNNITAVEQKERKLEENIKKIILTLSM